MLFSEIRLVSKLFFAIRTKEQVKHKRAGQRAKRAGQRAKRAGQRAKKAGPKTPKSVETHVKKQTNPTNNQKV